MKLCAYEINGQACGVDTSSWETGDLATNKAFVIGATVPAGYRDISSVSNWDCYGPAAGATHIAISDEISALYNATGSPEPDWDTLTLGEKKIVSKYFLVDKAKRDEVLTQDEQDEYDHFVLYHYLEDGDSYDMMRTPKTIDYKKDVSQRLHPKYTFDNAGFLVKVEYFSDLSVTLNGIGLPVYNFSNPVLKYEALYTENSDGYVVSRVVTRSWVLMSGSYSTDTKVSVKIYDSKTSREEGNRRRRNLINNLLIDTVGLFYITTLPTFASISETESDALALLSEIEMGISMYYESGAKRDKDGNPCPLIQQITASAYQYLDNAVPNAGGLTIRQLIISRLDP